MKMRTPFMPESLEDEKNWLKSNRSNSGAVEQRFQDFLGLEDFTRELSGRARVLRIIGIDHFYRLGDFA